MVIVTVPDSQRGQDDITSAAELEEFPMENMEAIVNCPVSFTAKAMVGAVENGAYDVSAGFFYVVVAVAFLL